MERLGLVAETYHCRPSQLVDESLTPYEAFCFDDACRIAVNALKAREHERAKEANAVQRPSGGGYTMPQGTPTLDTGNFTLTSGTVPFIGKQ